MIWSRAGPRTLTLPVFPSARNHLMKKLREGVELDVLNSSFDTLSAQENLFEYIDYTEPGEHQYL